MCLGKTVCIEGLGTNLDDREMESGASKIGTWRFAVQKDLFSCVYDEVVVLTKYIFGEKANEVIEIEEAVSVAQVSIPIFKSVLTSLKNKSVPDEIEDEVLDMVRIATADFNDMNLARRALDTVANTAKKKQGKTIMAHFVASKVGKHLLKEFGDRFESMAKDTVQRDEYASTSNLVKDFDPSRPRSDPTTTRPRPDPTRPRPDFDPT